ncbi:hypothetical protein N7510_001439 [Penicillium lagena]|uniref:uncharacterized protein n=1 Tax=Penicillium lagena TaxID=94218 RepID=UPI00254151A5|nr:uncharacterized protein N7510_001439 [Penicillium lagena]KAJ5625130.1 hypothetical protein N7510_001439 [Penicillium lagena]
MKESSDNKLIVVLTAIGAVLVVLFFSVLFLFLCVDTMQVIPRILVWIGVKKRETIRSISIVVEKGPEDAIEAKNVIKL